MLPFIFIALTFFLRLFWIEDMEFKGDEAEMSKRLSQMDGFSYPFITSPTQHSGIPHSSGGIYFLKLISLGIDHPVWLATTIVLMNALAISLGIWINRKSEKGLLTFILCATSFNLILGSRKIWVPDLMPIWVCLFLGLFIYSQSKTNEDKSSLLKNTALLSSAFFITFTGHMYLAGLLTGVLTTTCIAVYFFLSHKKAELKRWLAGSALGWSTWIPYFYLMLTSESGFFSGSSAIGKGSMGSDHLEGILNGLHSVFFLASPYGSHELYLLRTLNYLEKVAPPLLLHPLLWTLSFLDVLWAGLFLYSWISLFLRRKEALQDPLLMTSICVILGNVIGLEIVGIGNYLHYWFSAMPFAFYIIAWALTPSPPQKLLRKVLWTGVSASIIAISLFFLEVHHSGGLPGEYWMTYKSQTQPNPSP